MREIKFRCWDKELEKYLDQEIFITSKGIIFDEIGGYTKDSIIIEQYTGLKDKNGKEIYEGDILTSTIYPYKNDYGNMLYVGIVEYEPPSFYRTYHLVDKTRRGISNGIGEPLEYTESLEVIGNIHENPELLEEK